MNIERDYPVFFSENPEAFWATSLMLKDTGWVTGEGPMGHVDAIVTVSGWNRLTNLESVAGRITSKQVFVAMSFDDSLTAAFKDGITKALTLASYEPMRVDLKEHNDKICDVIISEIRRSKFLVADFTLHRPGVYFEAGYALGLGLPVIWTCRQDEVEKAHFDTRQYNHIVWKDPDELCEKLKRRIEATITT
jgi:nucleoside 2-deoxyribosyltransferase